MNLDASRGNEGALGDANAAERLGLKESINSFAGVNGDYYADKFTKIQVSLRLDWIFVNLSA